jgi:hypothetical protein
LQSLVEFADFRVLTFGTMTTPRTPASINVNAHLLLNPPGIEPRGRSSGSAVPYYAPVSGRSHIVDHGVYPVVARSPVSPSESAFFDSTGIILIAVTVSQVHRLPLSSFTYSRLTCPCPATIHSSYPFHTPGGADLRWAGYAEIEEGSRWVGGLLCVPLSLPLTVFVHQAPLG